jgi:uncharacterized protein YqeY
MELQNKLESDLKAALLGGEKNKVETIKGLKNALQYEAVSLKLKPADLNEEQIFKVLERESKRRQEAADLYSQAGEAERAQKEQSEKAIIDGYLPEKLSEDEVKAVVDEEVAKLDSPTIKDMGRIIGAVRQRLGAQADGATISRLVKEGLSQ